ncbi:MAG TPA: ATP-binding protein [Elusimicrobia bacterium]|nr:ATP-binding protein [Elusimicrobiota bacterium]HBT61418.1 ATP-binding protein [Elusimicrobiota bacterium]
MAHHHKDPSQPAPERSLPEGVKHIVAVGAGKGGVGKSTVAVNLAVALAQQGLKIGLLDADVYGPNLPQMLGAAGYVPQMGPDGKIEPASAHGVKLMSMGFLLDPESPVIWRGPLLHGAMNQFLKDVRWGELDCLVVDLPPGTGDVQISIGQIVPLSGAVIVTTPQNIALLDVMKAAQMFNKLDVPIWGVIENMAEFVCPHCRKASRIFSSGGARKFSEKYGVPLLGEIPLDGVVCAAAEAGTPACVAQPESAPARALRAAAKHVASRLSAKPKTDDVKQHGG